MNTSKYNEAGAIVVLILFAVMMVTSLVSCISQTVTVGDPECIIKEGDVDLGGKTICEAVK